MADDRGDRPAALRARTVHVADSGSATTVIGELAPVTEVLLEHVAV